MTTKYSEDHEWISVDDDIGTVGITNHAQSQLGDIVFVELPEVGSTVEAGDEAGVVESVKAASDLFTPCPAESSRLMKPLTRNQVSLIPILPATAGSSRSSCPMPTN